MKLCQIPNSKCHIPYSPDPYQYCCTHHSFPPLWALLGSPYEIVFYNWKLRTKKGNLGGGSKGREALFMWAEADGSWRGLHSSLSSSRVCMSKDRFLEWLMKLPVSTQRGSGEKHNSLYACGNPGYLPEPTGGPRKHCFWPEGINQGLVPGLFFAIPGSYIYNPALFQLSTLGTKHPRSLRIN